MNKPVIIINVTTYEAEMLEGKDSRVVMIPFSAIASGEYFTGKTVAIGLAPLLIRYI